MAGSRAAAALLLAAACGGGGGSSTIDARPDDFDRAAMAANLAANVIHPTYQAFQQRSSELSAAVAAWCDATGDADALAAARDGWRAAMAGWQRAEMMLVGPAAMDDHALRDVIYSWPTVSTCAVDQEVAMRRTDPGAYDISTRTANRRGLPALEYVLFTASLDHTCPSQIAPAGWNELEDGERIAARCGYAEAAAADVAARAAEVANGWTAYVTELSAGPGSSLSPQDAANLISDGMFYLDTDTKDMKLGEPAGIAANSCGAVEEPCPAELESPHARHSKENVVANLEAFRMLFSGDREPGGSGLGFDDYLVGVGAADLSTRMAADIDAALAAAGAIPGTLEEAIASSRDQVVSAHGAVKLVTDNLKSQFLTVLGLDAPDDAAADND